MLFLYHYIPSIMSFMFSEEFSLLTCSEYEAILFCPVGGVPDSGIENAFYQVWDCQTKLRTFLSWCVMIYFLRYHIGRPTSIIMPLCYSTAYASITFYTNWQNIVKKSLSCWKLHYNVLEKKKQSDFIKTVRL